MVCYDCLVHARSNFHQTEKKPIQTEEKSREYNELMTSLRNNVNI